VSALEPNEAMRRLRFHCQPEPGAFLHMLRPYRGVRDEVLRDVSSSLRACAERFREQQLPRDLMSAIWGISHLGRLWALAPDGMLRRNRLIDDHDLAKLQEFMDRFDLAVLLLLDGAVDQAFADWPSDP
jgi:hypothetical protein